MRRTIAMVMVCVALAVIDQAAAESVRRGGGDGASSALLQQITAERDSLLAKQGELMAEREGLSKDLEKSKARLTESEREIARLKSQLGESSRVADRAQQQGSATEEKLKETQEKLQKVVGKYKELVAELRQSEERASLLETSVGQKGDDLKQCVSDNQTLYQAAQELIREYENKGVWESLMQREPVTQLKRVEIESKGELYRDRVDQARFDLVDPASK